MSPACVFVHYDRDNQEGAEWRWRVAVKSIEHKTKDELAVVGGFWTALGSQLCSD
jgi:3-keto-L-gulonate-6-phosphate decarboxylase